MAQYAANEIENLPDSPVAREDLGAGGTFRGAGAERDKSAIMRAFLRNAVKVR